MSTAASSKKDASSKKHGSEDKGRTGRIVRLSIIGVLLAFALLSLTVFGFQICEPSTVFEANGTSCRAPNLTDAVTLVFFAGIGALLWPDLAEVGLFGFSAKRKAEKALEVADEASLTASAVRQEQLFGDNSSTAPEVDTLAEAMEQVDDNGHLVPVASSDARVGQVIRLWSELIARLTLDASDLMRGRKVDGWLDVDSTRPLKQRFIESHIAELKRVREVRNSAAHAVTVSAESLEQAIAIATKLLEELRLQGL